jgi:hypothetical protein
MSAWLRRKPTSQENAQALAVAVGVGATIAAVIFYLARLFIAREEVRPLRRRPDGRLEKV